MEKSSIFCSHVVIMLAMLCVPLVTHANLVIVNNPTSTTAARSSVIPIQQGKPYRVGLEHSQFIIKASEFEASSIFIEDTINSIMFYGNGDDHTTTLDAAQWCDYNVTLMRVPEGSVCTKPLRDVSMGTLVYAGPLGVVNGNLSVNFTTPYVYKDGDLLIDIDMTKRVGYLSSTYYFAGVKQTASAAHYANMTDTYNITDFSPKMQIGYSPKVITCPKVSNAVVSNINMDSARITWNRGGDETQWLLKVNDGDYMIVNDTTYKFEGLESQTKYNYEIYAFCGAGDTSRVVRGSFYSAVSTMPWFTSFEKSEGYEAGSAGGPATMGWAYLNSATTYPTTYIRENTGTSKFAYTGTQCLMLYPTKSATNKVYAIFPLLSDLNNKQVSFTYIAEYFSMSLGYMTDINDASTFVSIHSVPSTDGARSFVEPIVLPTMPAGARLAFRNESGRIEGWAAGIDDILVEEVPDCPVTPSALAATPTTSGAILTWSGSSDAYEIIVMQGQDTLVFAQVDEPTYTLTGLNAMSEYYLVIRIKGMCDAGYTNVYTEQLQLVTECGVVSVPWMYGFNYAAAQSAPTCLNVIGNTANTYVDGRLLKGKFTNYYEPQYVVLPEFAEDARTTILKYKFGLDKLTNTSVSTTMTVGLMSDPTDTTTFYPIATEKLNSQYQGGRATNDYSYNFDVAPAGYHYIAFRFATKSSTFTYYLDDIQVINGNSCFVPGPIQLVSKTDTSATFTWTPNGDETQWRFIDGNGDIVLVDEPYYTISGLYPNHLYTPTYSVQAYCSDEDQSRWRTQKFTYRTPMPEHIVDTLASGVTFASDFDNPYERAKWVAVEEGSTNKFTFNPTQPTAVYGSKQWGLYISYNNDNYLYVSTPSAAAVVRKFYVPEDSVAVVVDFKWKATGGNYKDFGRAFFAPDSAELVLNNNILTLDGTQIAPGATIAPNAFNFKMASNGRVDFYSSNSWVTIHDTVFVTNSGVYNLIYTWGNTSSSVYNDPLAVADVNLKLLPNPVVTFANHDGSVIKKDTVRYGGDAVAPADPERAATAEYTYTFAGWDVDFSHVTADIVVKAQYDSVVNKYVVTFVDYNDAVLKRDTVDYNTGAIAPADPERAATVEYTYTFAGWDAEFSSVIEDIVVKAQYDSVVNKYVATFVDYNDVVLKRDTVDYNTTATAPADPVRAATEELVYTFTGWDADFSHVTADITIKAQYKSATRMYIVSFVDYNDELIKRDSVRYNATAVAPADPERAATAEYTYTFSGWDVDFSHVTADIVVKAQYNSVVNKYVATFVDYNDAVLKRDTVDYNTGAIAPADPERAATVEYTYTFAGWDAEFSSVIEDIVVKAQYDSVVNKYVATFVDYNDVVLKRDTVDYNTTATAPADPVRAATEELVYTFTGWDVDFSHVTADITVKAQYKSATRMYIVSFVDYNDELIKRDSVRYNATAIAPADPERAATAEYTYTFAGWDVDFSHVTADIVVKAQYDSVVNMYVVTFVDYNDEVIKRDTVAYGGSAVAPEDPISEKYNFIGWDCDFSYVTSDLTIKALGTSTTGLVEVKTEPRVIKYIENGRIIIQTSDGRLFDTTGRPIQQ